MRAYVKGLTDTLAAVAVELDRLGSFRQRTDVVTVSQLRDEIEGCQELILAVDIDSLPSWFLLFESLQQRTSEIEDIINALAHEHGETNFKELRWWLGALQHQVSSCRRDADTLVPWGRLLSELQAVTANSDEETANAFSQLAVLLYNVPTLAELPQFTDVALVQLAALRGNLPDQPVAAFDKLTRAIEQGAVAAGDLLSRLSRLAHTAEQTKEAMDFKFLLDPERKVFTIGYNVSAQTRRQLLLRSACFRGTSRQFRRDRERRCAAGTLVQAGTPANVSRWRSRVDFLDRHDVRIPHAVARNARLSRHTPQRNLPYGRQPTNRIW